LTIVGQQKDAPMTATTAQQQQQQDPLGASPVCEALHGRLWGSETKIPKLCKPTASKVPGVPALAKTHHSQTH